MNLLKPESEMTLELYPLFAASWLQAGMGMETKIATCLEEPACAILPPFNELELPQTIVLLKRNYNNLQSIFENWVDRKKTNAINSLEVVLPSSSSVATRKTLSSYNLFRKELINVMTRSLTWQQTSPAKGETPSVAYRPKVETMKLTPDRVEQYVNLNQSAMSDPNSDLETFLVHNRLNSPTTELFLINTDNHVVGNFAIQYFSNPLDEYDRDSQPSLSSEFASAISQLQSTAFVFDLLVARDQRNRGIASETLNRIEKIASERGVNRIGVLAIPALVGFYERIGFVCESTMERWSSK